MAKRESNIIQSPAAIRGSSCEPPKGSGTDGLKGYGAPTRTRSSSGEKEVIFDKNGPEKKGDL